MTKKSNTENNVSQQKTTQKNNQQVVETTPRHGANHLSSGAKHSMKTRVISAIVMLAVVVPALFWVTGFSLR